jgi:hypothetical protein
VSVILGRMRVLAGFVLAAVAACGNVEQTPDASTLPDSPPGTPDAGMPDAGGCVDTAIFLGGMDVAAQGWDVTQSGAASVNTFGPTITQITTQTVGSGGAQLLISKRNAVTPGAAFIVELSMQVMAADPHNFLDGASVLMGSFSGGFGDGVERGEMIYIDPGAIGWADDTGTAPGNATDTFHNYRLSVDAGGNATVSRDGVALLNRAGFTTNGTIAFGDQTNDANVEANLLIRSVTLICPP